MARRRIPLVELGRHAPTVSRPSTSLSISPRYRYLQTAQFEPWQARQARARLCGCAGRRQRRQLCPSTWRLSSRDGVAFGDRH